MDYRESRRAGSVSMEERMRDDLEMLRKRARVANAHEAYEIAQEIREIERLIARNAQRRAEAKEYHLQKYRAPPPYSNVGVGANRWATHGEPSIGELWEADRLQNRSLDNQKVHIEPSPIIQPQENLVELEHLDEFIECTTITAPEIPCPTYEPVEELEEETIIDEDDEESSMATMTLEDDDDYQGALEFFNMLKAMSFPECAKEEQSFDIEICKPDEANEGRAVKYSQFEICVDSFEFKPGWLFETPSFDIKSCTPDEAKKRQQLKYSPLGVVVDTFEFKPGWLFGTPSMRKRDPPDRKRRALTERSHPVVKKIKRMRWLEVLLSKPP